MRGRVQTASSLFCSKVCEGVGYVSIREVVGESREQRVLRAPVQLAARGFSA